MREWLIYGLAAVGAATMVWFIVSQIVEYRRYRKMERELNARFHPDKGTSPLAYHNLKRDELWSEAAPDRAAVRQLLLTMYESNPKTLEIMREIHKDD
jgi:hypothetical protein